MELDLLESLGPLPKLSVSTTDDDLENVEEQMMATPVRYRQVYRFVYNVFHVDIIRLGTSLTGWPFPI